MKKLALLSLTFAAALSLSAGETILWEGLFNEFETDSMLCGLEDPFSGYQIDKMTGNCAPSTGDEPFAEELAIVEDAETGGKLLKVCRRDLDEDSPGCRGARTKLIWGEEEEKTEKDPEKEAREWKIIMTVTMIVSIGFSIGLFVVLPYLLSSLLRRVGANEVLISLTEALLRVAIFLLYMFLISRMKDIQRVFSYHGAEHKCINCIENGLDLNIENVLKSSRRHKRCGTSFLLIVIVISVIAFLFIGLLGITSPLWRFLTRIILIPIIAGVAFEFLRLAGSSDNPVVCTLAKPGLTLQGLVTREPDAEMAEVAIAAVNAVFDWKAWQKEQGIRS